jgi:hypothetical protein
MLSDRWKACARTVTGLVDQHGDADEAGAESGDEVAHSPGLAAGLNPVVDEESPIAGR